MDISGQALFGDLPPALTGLQPGDLHGHLERLRALRFGLLLPLLRQERACAKCGP
jgi:hypothetical protein